MLQCYEQRYNPFAGSPFEIGPWLRGTFPSDHAAVWADFDL